MTRYWRLRLMRADESEGRPGRGMLVWSRGAGYPGPDTSVAAKSNWQVISIIQPPVASHRGNTGTYSYLPDICSLHSYFIIWEDSRFGRQYEPGQIFQTFYLSWVMRSILLIKMSIKWVWQQEKLSPDISIASIPKMCAVFLD